MRSKAMEKGLENFEEACDEDTPLEFRPLMATGAVKPTGAGGRSAPGKGAGALGAPLREARRGLRAGQDLHHYPAASERRPSPLGAGSRRPGGTCDSGKAVSWRDFQVLKFGRFPSSARPCPGGSRAVPWRDFQVLWEKPQSRSRTGHAIQQLLLGLGSLCCGASRGLGRVSHTLGPFRFGPWAHLHLWMSVCRPLFSLKSSPL